MSFKKKFAAVSFAVLCGVLLFQVKALGQDYARAIIDSLQKKMLTQHTEEEYINNSFSIADNFMELDQYDSAQQWLNNIMLRLPLKKPSLANYFLSSRQAEVYYYNGLQRLGLQEAQRSLSIAQALNDSLLLADSYNFIGLFYVNLDSCRQAIRFFKKGILFSKQPPFPNGYLSLTKPHHLYGNMAEAYQKINAYDSAIYNAHISLQKATLINWGRGMAVARNNLGISFVKTNQPDSALLYFTSSFEIAKLFNEVDVELIDYAGLATAYHLLYQKTTAKDWLDKGFKHIERNPFINSLFMGQFLDDAIGLYKLYGDESLLAKALQQKVQLQARQINNNNKQVNAILQTGLQNETRLLSLEIKEAKNYNNKANARIFILIALVLVMIAGFIFYRYKTKQKFQLVRLQNKISQDLHDDVGSSLSSLQVYSAVAKKLMDTQPIKAKEMLERIANEAAVVMDHIGDIVWSMKTVQEQSLDKRIKNFSADLLGAASIEYKVFIEAGAEECIRSMQARRSVLLIIKEALNNTVKYGKANFVAISIKKLAGHLCVQVTDNGCGFSISDQEKKGNGLSNMRTRTLDLGGMFDITATPGKGTTVSALFPLPNISEEL